ncbi:hypothetical protein HL653_19710 [Sphingomonas sp. AP4-R1]|uniref:hypothetical protein n=1 Tax=Sphingomonas sp. AP4-R1 TaxID=2735134 RepID=UPI00149389BC|nr:hypothetical protein [Sphingomonas sp. AP4-R1]QJU59683.1 hypothetical protein HL653_19710 [Sphingomonas sp. AP4-R1]
MMSPATAKRRRRLELYATASIAGLSVVMAPQPVRAQAINASGVSRFNTNDGVNSATVINSGTSTLIQVNSSKAIIDWTPNSDQFVLPGRTATFYNTNSGGYTVLNVIASGTTPMRFDGTVESRIGSTTGAIGGNVWFYSPGGMIVGSTASFNVGSLLLTTLNPVYGTNPGDTFFDFNDGTNGARITLQTDPAIFGAGNNNTSQISIAGNAAILAQSYVGIVAPRIVQTGGSIQAGGAIGFIAGEQVNLDIASNGGLFGISIPVGTSFTGTTTTDAAIVKSGGNVGTDATGVGAASTASNGRKIYMIAVPKNDAVTMLLTGGEIGYGASSATATTDGIVLLASENAGTSFDGSGDPNPLLLPTNANTTGAIKIGGQTATGTIGFSSSLTAISSNVIAEADAANLRFDGDTTLLGGLASSLTVASGVAATANRDLTIRSVGVDVNGSTIGGIASVTVDAGGTLRIDAGRTLTIDAGSLGVDNFDSGTNSGLGGSVTGGDASLMVSGGTLEGLNTGDVGGSVDLRADGVGGQGVFGGGDGTGGSVTVAMNGGSAHVTELQMSVYGAGGQGPANGNGGTATLTATGGALTVDGNLSIDTYGLNASGNRDGNGGGVTISTAGGGPIIVGGNFGSISNGLTSITGSGTTTPAIQAGRIGIQYSSLSASNAFLDATASNDSSGTIDIAGVGDLPGLRLRAVNGISLSSASGITISDASVTVDAQDDGEGNLDTNLAYVLANAGSYEGPLSGTSSPDATIAINGPIRANGQIRINASGSIDIAATGSIVTDNTLQIGAGGDLRIAALAVLNAGANRINQTDTGIDISVGGDSNSTDPVHSLISAGTINANDAPLSIYADAFQTQNGSMTGGAVTLGLTGNGTIGDDDGGQLLTTCSAGSMCLGGVSASSLFFIDRSNLQPQTVWLAGNMTVPTLDIHATNGILLGQNGGRDITVAGLATLDAGTGSILATPGASGTIAAASMQLIGTDLVAQLHTFRTTSGDLTIDVTRDVQAAAFDVFGQLGHTGQQGFQADLLLDGSFFAGTSLSVGTGNVLIAAQGITIGRLEMADGSTLDLEAQSGPLQLLDASTSRLGTIASAQLRGFSVSVGALTTTGDVTLNAAASDLTVDDLVAGGIISATGNVVSLRSSGAMTVSSLSAGEGGAELISAGDLSISTASVGSAASYASTGGNVSIGQGFANSATTISAAGGVTIGTLSAGSLDITALGGGIAADRLYSGGGTNLAATGLIDLPVFLSAGTIRAVGGGVRIITDPMGDTAAQSLSFSELGSIGGDVIVSSLENIAITGGSVIGAATITTSAQLGLSDFTATGDLALSSITANSVSNIAGRNVSIINNNGITGQGLVASGTTTLTGGPGTISISGLESAGGITVDSRNIILSSQGDMAVTRATANGSLQLTAGGTLTIATASSEQDSIYTSVNGRITAQSLSSGGPVSFGAPGAVTVTNLTTSSNVSMDVGSAQIGSTGSLTFANAIGRTGGINLSAQGALTVGPGRGAGDSSFTAGGPLSVTSFTTTGDLALQGTTIDAFTSLSGRNVSLTAITGNLAGQTLGATGTTTISAPGEIRVGALTSAGAVTATGGSVVLTSPGALTFANVSGSDPNGQVTLTANGGSLTINAMTAPGFVTLASSGALTLPSFAAGLGVDLRGASILSTGAISGSSVIAAASNGDLAIQSLTSAGLTSLVATGTLSIASLTSAGTVQADGGSIAIGSPGSLIFDGLIGRSATGSVTITTAQALTVNGGIAQGSATLNAGTVLTAPTITALSGDLTLTGNTISAFTAIAGRNVSLAAASGSISGQALNATGTVSLTAPVNVSVAALGAVGPVSATARGIALTAPNAMTVANATAGAGGMTLSAANLLTVNNASSAADLVLTSANGGITIGTAQAATGVTLTAPGAIAVTGDLNAPTASVRGGSVAINATRDLVFSSLVSSNGDAVVRTSGALAVNGGSSSGATNFSAGGALGLSSFSTGTDITLSAASLPTFTNLSGRNISLTVTGGDLTGGTLIASGTTSLSASGILSITDLRSTGAATLSGGTVNVGSTGTLTVTRATAGDGGLRLRAAGTLSVANAASSAGVDLASTGGDLTLGTITMTGTPAGITGQAVAGTSPLTLASTGTTTLNGDITGAGAATISGAGLILNGLIDASAISLASQTIAVGPAALIGTLARTGTVAFVNTGTGRSFIGGTGNANGYSLDAGALSRIQASSVTIALPRAATSSTATPDVVIGGFTLYGTGAAAPAGSRQNLGTGLLTISTPGQVQVTGPVLLANLPGTTTGGLAIRALGIDVVTPGGSIIQTNAAGAPAGTLDLDARVVRVGSAAALANVGTLDTATAREARLAQNDGNLSETGWLSANTIRFAYPSGISGGSGIAAIYVQNSGGAAASARRGVTTGTGGIVIADFPTGDQPEVFINGRGRDATGTFVTGSAFLASISQTGAGAGATDVLVNGCVLSSGACSGQSVASTLISQLVPPQDLVGVISSGSDGDDDEDSNKPGDPVPSKDPQSLIQMAPPNPEADTQNSDDPVIGAGNDSLWNGGGGPGGDAGGASPFDTTIGVGNDAGSPNSDATNANDRPGAGGSNGGTGGPQQPGERAPGVNPSTEGGLGIGNDAGAGGEQRSGAAGANAGAGVGITTPGTSPTPGALQNGGGAIGVGGDAGGGAGNANGGSTLPGATQGSTGGTTNGATNNNGRPNGGAPGQTTPGGEATSTGGDASGNGSGTAGAPGTPGSAATTTPGTTNNNNRQTEQTTPR